MRQLAFLTMVLAGIVVGCSNTKTDAGPAGITGEIYILRQQALEMLYKQEPFSDAEIILNRALARTEKLPDDKETAKVLYLAIRRADKANRFKIYKEAPLPKGWPAPSLPGLVRIKQYPPCRVAEVDKSRVKGNMFMMLFKHIKRSDIKMTAPVVMTYDSPVSEELKKSNMDEMAFLYRYPTQGKDGTFGAVKVLNQEPMMVISVGIKGSYKEKNYNFALDSLRFWLKDNQDEWEVAGPPRVLGYNSPFMPSWMKYAEVQIPIKRKE